MKKVCTNKKSVFMLIFILIITSIATIATSSASIFGATNEVSYTVQNDWGSGATVSVTIKNTSSEKIDGWVLKWNFPGDQKITSLWNADYKQDGSSVTVTGDGWSKVIAPNDSVHFGFMISYSKANPQPTDFSLNEADVNLASKPVSETTTEEAKASNTSGITVKNSTPGSTAANLTTASPITASPTTSSSWADSIYNIDGFDRITTFKSLFNVSGTKFFYEDGSGKVIDGLHYGTGTRTGSSQFGGHFFGEIVLPDEIKDNVVAINRFDLFSDQTYANPILAGAVLEIQHIFLDESGNICSPKGTNQDKAYVICTDSMFDGGRIKGDIDIFETTYDKIQGSTLGGGCLFVNWKVVEFSNLSNNLKLSYKWKEAQNPFYLAFKLLWHKLPIKSVSFKGTELARTQDNVFKMPTQAISVSDSAEITINYIDGTSETVTIGGPEDTEIHTVAIEE